MLFTACNAGPHPDHPLCRGSYSDGSRRQLRETSFVSGGRGRSCGNDFVRNLQLFQQDDTGQRFENFMKNIRDTLFHHIDCPSPGVIRPEDHPTLCLRRGGDPKLRLQPDAGCVRIVFLMVLYLGIMFSMNVKLSLVAAALSRSSWDYSVSFIPRSETGSRRPTRRRSSLSTVQENLTGVRVVRAFGREKFEIDRFDERNERRFAGLWIKLGRIMSAYWATGDFITGIQILTVLVTGTVLVVLSGADAGRVSGLCFLQLLSLTWPIRSLGRILSRYMSKAGVSVETCGLYHSLRRRKRGGQSPSAAS